jgi:anti-anti-sigma factor
MARIFMTGELTIYQAAALKQQLAAALEQSHMDLEPIRIDLSGVTECDGAGLQLLLASAKSVAGTETELILHRVPESITELFNTYNITNRFTLVQEPINE